ncbi:sigma-70 family RNA polymerase sigma factor [Nocardia sp. NPDC049149]|uniref:sigma-70 family RNA polymerase sigma factor n=1 Tax=Nocardia sp. NPDC049149 TaxID=3364315 RepID=UPI00370F8648
MTADDFEQVRNDPDPIRRGQRASELMVVYQQRVTELARLRKAAIEEAHRHGLSYVEIAERFGITKGRITQIRSEAPRAERAFFGVGPVAVGIPRRLGFEEGRERPFFDANDQATQEAIEATVARLALSSSRFAIDRDCAELPTGDAVVICGPKSAPIAGFLLTNDPVLSFRRTEEDGWSIADSRTNQHYVSPYRRDSTTRTDVGYFSRRQDGGRIVVHIAGITSVGSLGVAHWLDRHLPEVFEPPSTFLSGVVECEFTTDFTVIDTRLIAGPYSDRA